MTVAEVEAYYETLDVPQAKRYNLLVSMYLKLGKPIEGGLPSGKDGNGER